MVFSWYNTHILTRVFHVALSLRLSICLFATFNLGLVELKDEGQAMNWPVKVKL